ncbi:hypothetical protein LG315_01180 [Microbacterium marinum]|uniref:glycosyltransferase n=1 Tax=Microbacterium marinum TaxID=421115 RepID=UPI00384E1CD3
MTTAAASGRRREVGGNPAVSVVAVPAGHPYVRAVTADPSVRVLPDPPVPGAAAGVWWPPPALDPGWIAANRAEAQLLHIHFGTESFSPAHLVACIDAAHAVGWPVVFTLHDLDHPQLSDSSAYVRQLDEIIPRADAVLTLTSAAARVVRDRWHREAEVVPHPAVLPPDAEVPRPARDAPLIGTHLKDLRPNVDGPVTARAIVDATGRLRGAGVPVEARVLLHDRVRDEAARDEVLRICDDVPGVSVMTHARLDDDALHHALSQLDVCILPYRHGTHSGWLELCWDLGVAVAAPRVGFFDDQHVDDSVHGFIPGDGDSLAVALQHLLAASPRPCSAARASLIARRRAERANTDAAVVAHHARLYRRLIEERAR